MEVETKYNLGDYILVDDFEKEKITCPICDGEGSVIINDITCRCPKCNGEKIIWHSVKTQTETKITDIYLHLYKDEIHITYGTPRWNGFGYDCFGESRVIKKIEK